MLVACPQLDVDISTLDLGQALKLITKLQQQYIMCAVKDDCLIAAEKDANKQTSISCKQATDQLKAKTDDNTTSSK